MRSREEVLQAAEVMKQVAERAADRAELDQCGVALAIRSALLWCAGEFDFDFGEMLQSERERSKRVVQSIIN